MRSIVVVVAAFVCAIVAGNARSTVIEFSIDKAPLAEGVGTCFYEATPTEKSYYDRLSEGDRVTTHSGPSDQPESSFTLRGHEGQFVSWFGVVREIKPDATGSGGRLLVQNTYSEDLTDCHIQTVSLNGAGDFEVESDALPPDLIPLVLIRVYGVESEHDPSVLIRADYIRVWHFGQFNFMDYGQDHSNPEWRKRIHLPEGESFYHFWGSRKYYNERLGPTDAQWEDIAAFHRGQTDMDFESQDPAMTPSYSPYQPGKWEQPYFDRLSPQDRITVASGLFERGNSKFKLSGHLRQFVSWFGIVREMSPYIGRRGGTLLIQNTYSNGNSDEKLQTISLRGGGDFSAELTNLSEELEPPALVRVYGTVTKEEGDKPTIAASYLRGWHIGQFNFDDYGSDKTNPRWKKNVRLGWFEPTHKTEMSAAYYIDRLGLTGEQADRVKQHFDWKKEEEDEKRKREEATPTPAQ